MSVDVRGPGGERIALVTNICCFRFSHLVCYATFANIGFPTSFQENVRAWTEPPKNAIQIAPKNDHMPAYRNLSNGCNVAQEIKPTLSRISMMFDSQCIVWHFYLLGTLECA